MSGPSTYPVIVRATSLTLQTTSWVLSFWVPVIVLVLFSKRVFAGTVDRRSIVAALALTGGAIVLAWVLSRVAHSLLDGSRLAAVLLASVLVAAALVVVYSVRRTTDPVQETARFVWAVFVITWSGLLVVAAVRRSRIGERA